MANSPVDWLYWITARLRNWLASIECQFCLHQTDRTGRVTVAAPKSPSKVGFTQLEGRRGRRGKRGKRGKRMTWKREGRAKILASGVGPCIPSVRPEHPTYDESLFD